MMKLYGRTLKGRMLLADAVATNEEENLDFQTRLEKCLLGVCHEFNISVPLWIDRNTSEFVHFKRTTFHSEQFIDKVNFDRLIVEMVFDER